MTENEKIIFATLLLVPGHAFVSPDGTKLYALVSEEDGMIVFTGEFSGMTDEQLNQYICDTLAPAA